MSTDDPNEDELEDEGMTFWEHLDELRQRVLKMAIAGAIGAAVAWFFHEEILQWLLAPFQEAWRQHFNEEPQINFRHPADIFITYLKLTMIAGCIFALPIIFYQLWAFIAPGLYKREKRYAIPFVVASTGLFSSGAFFGMKLAFPIAFAYLLGFADPTIDQAPDQAVAAEQGAAEGAVSASGTSAAPQAGPAVSVAPATPSDRSTIVRAGKNHVTIKATIMIDDYIEFISRMLLAFGIVFELPVVVFFLSVAGLVNHKHLIKFFRYFIVIAFTVSAVFTPPDLMSQFLLAVPMTVLYVLSIGIAYVFGKKEPSVGLGG